MRILIDLQGAQSTSALRGIGRYTTAIADGIIRHRSSDDVHVLLNEAFPESTIALRERFAGLLGPSNVHSFSPVPGNAVHFAPAARLWRDSVNERLREAVISRVAPDLVLVSSLFEGRVDDAVASTASGGRWATAVVLYDLIPFLFPETYLVDPALEQWFRRRIEQLRGADLLLAISDHSRRDAIQHLDLDPRRVVNISGAVDTGLFDTPPDEGTAEETCARLGLSRPYLMYTGGVDHRKNLQRLIEAYAAVRPDIRAAHQLAIVCAMSDDVRASFAKLMQSCGLQREDVVLTGFVSEHDLVTLYRGCTAFVFPSWYEGFGLPVLEAMVAGRAVIGSNASSIPEVIGRDDALFDPEDTGAITAAIERVLSDDAFREDLERWAAVRATEFSWDHSASRALEAMRSLDIQPVQVVEPPRRPTLAFLSPLPPSASGIADYSAELLPHLAEHYDITLVLADGHPGVPRTDLPTQSVDWFRAHHRQFDRVVYQFGNSDFHTHMFELLDEIPGVVVLHDFFLSGIISYLDRMRAWPGEWNRALYRSHGYHAVKERLVCSSSDEVVFAYPANLRVLQAADGVIVHSEHARRLAQEWYGAGAAEDWSVVPLLRERLDTTPESRTAARRALGFGDDEFVVCTFGLAAPTKLVHRVVAGFGASSLAGRSDARLVVAGELSVGPYGDDVAAALQRLGAATGTVTGRLSSVDFRHHLLACDVAVQLRTNSRGETSAAVLDCMNAGVAVIVNAHGSAADLPTDCVSLIPDQFTDDELAQALDALAADAPRRAALAAAGQALVHTAHSPTACAAQYHDVIERTAQALHHRSGVRRHLAPLAPEAPKRADLTDLAVALARSLPPLPRQTQWLVDVGDASGAGAEGLPESSRSALRTLLLHPPAGVRVEPVHATRALGLRYARRFTRQLLGVELHGLDDDPAEFAAGDVYALLDGAASDDSATESLLLELRAAGVTIRESLAPG